PLGWTGRAAKWVRRRPMMAASLGLLVVVVLAFGLGAWRYHRDLDDYEAVRSTAAQERGLAEERQTLNRRLNYAIDLADLAKRWKAGQREDLSQRLDRLRPEVGQLDVRGFEWFYLRQRRGNVKSLPDLTRRVSCLRFSADGRTLAALSKNAVYFW